MFRFAASLSRRALLAAAVAVVSMVVDAGVGRAGRAAGDAAVAEREPVQSGRWWCSTSARRSMAAAPRPIAKAHIPGAVHSDYDKAGWRVTRNGVPFMLPTTAELEKLIGETGIDEDSHVVDRAGRRQRHRLRLGRARLLDAEGRGPSGGVDPRRRLRRLAGGVLSGRDRQEPAVAEDLHRQARRLAARRGRSGGAQCQRDAARCAARELLRRPGRRRRPSKAYGHIPGAINLDSATFYDPATNRLRRRRSLPRSPAKLPAGPVVSLLQHRPLGGDQLVRAVGDARPARRAALRRLDGRMDRRCAPSGRLARARAGTM